MLKSNEPQDAQDYQVVSSASNSLSKLLAVLTVIVGSFSSASPLVMAQSTKELLTGEFSDVLGSLRNGTGDPKESNEKLQLKQFSQASDPSLPLDRVQVAAAS